MCLHGCHSFNCESHYIRGRFKHIKDNAMTKKVAAKEQLRKTRIDLTLKDLDKNHPVRLVQEYNLRWRSGLRHLDVNSSVSATSNGSDFPKGQSTSSAGALALLSSSRTSSPLLDLPPELRNWIYEAVLLSPSPIIVARPPLFKDWKPNPLLHTCRQIRNEASQMYWALNTFTPNSVTNIHRRVQWLAMIGPQQYRMIRKIYLNDEYYMRESKAVHDIRTYCNTLANIRIRLAPTIFYVHAWVDGLRDPVWLNMRDMVFLRQNENWILNWLTGNLSRFGHDSLSSHLRPAGQWYATSR